MSDWSGFEGEVRARSNRFGPECGVAALLNGVPAEAGAQIRKVLADRGVSASAIRRSLVERVGEDVPSEYVIRRHRHGTCKCQPEEWSR